MSAITFHVERTSPREAEGGAVVSPSGRPSSLTPSPTTTVPQEFVHRAAIAEVMLTTWKREDDIRFTVTAQPCPHGFFTRLQGWLHDPLIVTETIRQVGSLLAHAEYEVPLGHHLLMWRLDIAVEPAGLPVGGTPASLELLVTATEVNRHGGRLAQLGHEATILRDGIVTARGAASFSTTTPAAYRRLRGSRDPAGIRPVALMAPASPQRYVELDECFLIEAAHQGLSADGTTQSVLVTGRQNACEVFPCLVTAAASPR